MAEENAIDDPMPTAPERLLVSDSGLSLSAAAVAEVEPVGAEPSPLRAFWSAFSENRGAVLGLAVVVFITLLALFAPFVAPHSPIEQFRQSVLLPPVWAGGNWTFPFGTDAVGRDVLSRLIYGARISLGIGLSVMVVSVALGIVLGLASAFLRGLVEVVIMRVMDMVVAIPSLVLAILIVAVLGPSLTNTIVAVTVVYLPRYVRLVRAAALAELSKEYVVAAQVAGVGRLRLMFVTVLPNCLAPAHRAGRARHFRRHSGSGGARLSRPRRAAADAGMGRHAGRCARVHPLRPVDRHPARPRHSRHRGRHQPDG